MKNKNPAREKSKELPRFPQPMPCCSEHASALTLRGLSSCWTPGSAEGRASQGSRLPMAVSAGHVPIGRHGLAVEPPPHRDGRSSWRSCGVG